MHKYLLYVARRPAGVAALLTLWTFTALLPAAPPTVRITSPLDGAVVNSGQTLVVTVDATPGAFQWVSVGGDDPLGVFQALAAPPYQFTITIRPDIPSGTYGLFATGVIQPGNLVDSDPIHIDIERADSPQQLEPQFRTLGFAYVGDDDPFVVTGIFADGSRVDLTHSMRTRYKSSNPSVVTVNSDGMVTAVGPGSARLIIRNGSAKVVVPVTVPNERPPEQREQ